MMQTEQVLDCLCGVKKTRNGWTALCPAHDDKNASLSIGRGDGGKVLLKCHAGCTYAAVVEAAGLRHVTRNGHSQASPTPPTLAKPPNPPKGYSSIEDATTTAVQVWQYVSADGEPAFWVARYERGGKKTFRPYHRTAGGVVCGDPLGALPLYRLPELVDAETVYVCEGEQAADAARSIGLTAVTSSHGSRCASKTDWTPVAGKDVVILPDNDEPGRAYANDVAAILTTLDPPAMVKIVELPGLPPGGDIVEYVEANNDADRTKTLDVVRGITSLADAASVFVPTIAPADGTQAETALQPYIPFVTDALPEPLRTYVRETADAIGVDDAYVALPLLSALASAIGSTHRLLLKPGYSEPAIIWTAIVGPSGTMKTPVIAEVMRPVKNRQREAYDRYEKKMSDYQKEVAVWERDYAAWKRKKNDAGDPPEAPEEPVWDRCWISDVTIEKVAVMLQDQPRGLLLIRDELSGWLGSFDKYSKSSGSDVASWIEMYGGLSTVIDRKTGPMKTIRVPFAHVCIAGGIQLGPLRRALSTEHRENGLASRLFLACPPNRVVPWSERHASDESLNKIATVFDRLYKLVPDADDFGTPKPHIAHLTPAAKKVWIAYHDRNGREQAGLSDDLRAAWSKLKGGAARMALVMHHVRSAAGDPAQKSPVKVDAASMEAGVALADWFKNEAKRVYAILADEGDDGSSGPPVVLSHIVKLGGSVSVRDWQRHRSHPTSHDSEAELSGLVAAGYGHWVTPPQIGRGGPRSKLFVVN